MQTSGQSHGTSPRGSTRWACSEPEVVPSPNFPSEVPLTPEVPPEAPPAPELPPDVRPQPELPPDVSPQPEIPREPPAPDGPPAACC